MSFMPALVGEGYSGWQLLKKQMPTQKQAYTTTGAVKREAEYFRQKISAATTAEDLIADRTLLKVALTAFGLEADLGARAFIGKILSDGVSDNSALANRLADKSYYALSRGFALDGSQPPATQDKAFVDQVIADFHTRSFEAAVGEVNNSYRLALNAERELYNISRNSLLSEDAKWFTIMGSKPLRTVFEKAFGLSEGFGSLDIDRQLKALKAKASAVLGNSSVSQFQTTEQLDRLTRHYLIKSAASTASNSPAQNALTLLSQPQTRG